MLGRRKFRSKQARRREHKRLAIVYSLSVVGFVLLLVLIAYGLQWQALRVQTIAVETDGAIETARVSAQIHSTLDSNALFVFPRDSAFLIRTKKLEEDIRVAFPRAETVRVRRSGLTKLAAHIAERSPEALWCGDVVPPVAYTVTENLEQHTEEVWGTCYLIDATGFMYARAPLYTGNIFPRYYGSLIESDPIGQQYLHHEEFERWQTFFYDLRESELGPLALLLVDERDVELYLDNGLRVQLPRNEDLDLIRRRLLATLETDAIDMTRTVEYLDLRFGSKAFVRYVDSVEELPAEE